jgi:hypothetical protein
VLSKQVSYDVYLEGANTMCFGSAHDDSSSEFIGKLALRRAHAALHKVSGLLIEVVLWIHQVSAGASAASADSVLAPYIAWLALTCTDLL